jgi:hypothetical protein
MSWNYRLVKKDGTLSVREVYYNKDGTVSMMSSDDHNILSSFGDTQDAERTLEMIKRALTLDILDDNPDTRAKTIEIFVSKLIHIEHDDKSKCHKACKYLIDNDKNNRCGLFNCDIYKMKRCGHCAESLAKGN